MSKMIDKILLRAFLLLILSSCSKEEQNGVIDHGEKYYGTYNGIQIYTDFQQAIIDTTNQSIRLSRHDSNSVTLIKVELPETFNKYFFRATDSSIAYYGNCYHCPGIGISGDTLTGSWFPSLGPRKYEYFMIKE